MMPVIIERDESAGVTQNVEKPTLKQSLQEWLAVLSFRWLAAESTPIQPDPYPYDDSEEAFVASAARGHQVFNAETQGSCISCHKNSFLTNLGNARGNPRRFAVDLDFEFLVAAAQAVGPFAIRHDADQVTEDLLLGLVLDLDFLEELCSAKK